VDGEVPRQRPSAKCDLLICPPELARFGTYDAARFHEILEIGYQAARERMPEIEGLVRQGAAPAEG